MDDPSSEYEQIQTPGHACLSPRGLQREAIYGSLGGMRPKTLLMVSDAWKLFAEAEQLALLIEALAARGHSLHLATQPESPLHARLDPKSCLFHDLAGLRGGSPAQLWGALRALRRLYDLLRPEIVYAVRSRPHLLMIAALRHVAADQRPLLLRGRGGAQKIRRGFLNRQIYDRFTDATCVPSKPLEADMVASGFDAAQIKRLPCAVDAARLLTQSALPEQATPAAVSRGALSEGSDQGPAGPRVGLVGRFARVKGHRVLIEALPAVCARFPELQVEFIGPPSGVADEETLADELLAQAQALGVAERLHFRGPIGAPFERGQMGEVYRRFDLIVAPSLGSEVIARVPLEAMALGVPVVVSQVGVLPEIVRAGETGWVVPLGDPEALAQAMIEALQDRPEAQRRATLARQQVEAEHGPEQLARRFEAICIACDPALG